MVSERYPKKGAEKPYSAGAIVNTNPISAGERLNWKKNNKMFLSIFTYITISQSSSSSSSARPHGVSDQVFPNVAVSSCRHHIRHSSSTQPGLQAVQHFFSCLPLLLFLSSLPVKKCSKPSLLITWIKKCCLLFFYLLHQ